jgi:hypothetical protein
MIPKVVLPSWAHQNNGRFAIKDDEVFFNKEEGEEEMQVQESSESLEALEENPNWSDVIMY